MSGVLRLHRNEFPAGETIRFVKEIGKFSRTANGEINLDLSCRLYLPKLLSKTPAEPVMSWLQSATERPNVRYDLHEGFEKLITWQMPDDTINDIFNWLNELNVRSPINVAKLSQLFEGAKWICKRYTLIKMARFSAKVDGICHLFAYNLHGLIIICGGETDLGRGSSGRQTTVEMFAGFKLEQILTASSAEQLSEPINRHSGFYSVVRVDIGAKQMLISAEMDCHDGDGHYIEVKLVKEAMKPEWFEANIHRWALQCQLGGVERLVVGKHRREHSKSVLVGTKELVLRMSDVSSGDVAAIGGILNVIESVLTGQPDLQVCHIQLSLSSPNPNDLSQNHLNVNFAWLNNLEAIKYLPHPSLFYT